MQQQQQQQQHHYKITENYSINREAAVVTTILTAASSSCNNINNSHVKNEHSNNIYNHNNSTTTNTNSNNKNDDFKRILNLCSCSIQQIFLRFQNPLASLSFFLWPGQIKQISPTWVQFHQLGEGRKLQKARPFWLIFQNAVFL